jgi:hypothetical protein
MTFKTDVPGWMTDADLNVLYKLASMVPESGSILEVGCFLGRSTSALYSGKHSSVTLTVVDTFQKHTGYDTDYDIFKERVNSIGESYVDAYGSKELYNMARAIAGKEDSWLNGFKLCIGEEMYNSLYVNKTKFDNFDTRNSNYNLAFIDASHLKQDAVNDISRFVSNNNTLIVGDDFDPKYISGVISAIVEVRRANKHLLIVPENSKLWILVPREGYWKEQFRNSNSCFFD